jgi:hypothetical protein
MQNHMDGPGLPDGLFSNQKSQIWVNFGGSLNGKCWYIFDHLEYFLTIWYNLWPFGIVCGHLLYFSQFGMFGPRKIWQPWDGPSLPTGSPRKPQLLQFHSSSKSRLALLPSD